MLQHRAQVLGVEQQQAVIVGNAKLSFLIVLAALAFLMVAAYRGYSVILFAPIAALGAVLFTDPSAVAPVFSGIFMEKMVGFVKLYFPVFMLGAVFGKVIEMSGFSKSIVAGRDPLHRPLARERRDRRRLRAADLWRRVAVRGGVRGVSVCGRALPPEQYSEAPDAGRDRAGRLLVHHGFAAGHPADPEHHPDHLLQDHRLGRAVLGTIGSLFIIVVGLSYLEWRRRAAMAKGEGYGAHAEAAERVDNEALPHPFSPSCRWCWWASPTSCSPR
jgi:hypothetical protein